MYPRTQYSSILVAHHPLLLRTMRHHHRTGHNRENSFRIGILLRHNLSRDSERAENCEKVSKLLEMTVCRRILVR